MIQEIRPIAFRQVNERAVQINAALTIFAILFFFFTSYKWILLVLSVDFLIRGFLNPAHSFFSAISKTILRSLKIKPSMVDAGPKIFAARIGFLMCCLMAVFYLLDIPSGCLLIGSLFVFFGALEAIFRFCVACKVYYLIPKVKAIKSDSSPD